MVAKENDWVVVHGSVFSSRLGRRMDHAWCERGDMVVDLIMPVGLRIIDRVEYYRIVKPVVNKVYSSSDALVLSIRTGHDGPWNESEQLKQ